VMPTLEASAVEEGALPRLSWPAWLGHDRLCVSATTADGRPAIYALEPGKPGKTLLYRPPPGLPAEIAPALPHYLNPSPDGRHAALATPGDGALTLFMLDAEQPGSPPELTRGAPLFSCWAPSGDALLVHAGAIIHRVDRDAPEAITTVGLNSVDI